MRVLLCAYACSPVKGSEPGIGWYVAQTLGRDHDIVVVTHARNRRDIELAEPDSSVALDDFLFVDFGPYLRQLQEAGRWGRYAAYLAWQACAVKCVRERLDPEEFDVVHHVTYGNPWVPSLFSWLDRPFVWNAGLARTVPLRFLLYMSKASAAREAFRAAVIKLAAPIVMKAMTRRPCSVAMTLSAATAPARGKVDRFAIGGLSPGDLRELSRTNAHSEHEDSFRMLSVGRFLGLKGFELGIRAYASVSHEMPNSEYIIVGDGPESARLHRLVLELDIPVRIMPWMDRENLFDLIRTADVAIQPSIYEQFGYSVLESMAAGVVPVVLDVGGPGWLVSDGQVGRSIGILNPRETINNLGQAIYDLYADQHHRRSMSIRAQERAYAVSNPASLQSHLETIYRVAVSNSTHPRLGH